MSSHSPVSDLELTLYRRASVPAATRERIDALEGEISALEGMVSSVDVATWPACLTLADLDATPDVADVLNEAQELVDQGTCSLTPAVTTRTCYDYETGDRFDGLVLPVVGLTVREDGDLVAFYPHSNGDVVTVEDALTDIAQGDRSTEWCQSTAKPSAD
jgi:hypothetical protein